MPERRVLKKSAVTFLRNLFCGSLAIAITFRGRASSARRAAFEKGTVTSVYFHNPNRRLFTNCIRWLKRHGYQFISLEQLVDVVYNRSEPPRGAVWLSFDDGYRKLLNSVIPVVRKEGIPITLFIPTGIVEGKGLFPWEPHPSTGGNPVCDGNECRDSMTVSEVKQVACYPEVSLGSHTVNHALTPTLTEDMLRFELQESKRRLESWIGRPVSSFAYPVGQFDGRESNILSECGYDIAVTTEAAFVTGSATAFEVPRFHVGDNIPFREAVCNMLGIWRPSVDPLFRFLRHRPTLVLPRKSSVA